MFAIFCDHWVFLHESLRSLGFCARIFAITHIFRFLFERCAQKPSDRKDSCKKTQWSQKIAKTNRKKWVISKIRATHLPRLAVRPSKTLRFCDYSVIFAIFCDFLRFLRSRGFFAFIIAFSLKWSQASPMKLKMMIKCAAPRPQRFYHHFQLESSPASPIRLKVDIKCAAKPRHGKDLAKQLQILM